VAHDLVIRNGSIIDGTGAAAYPADVAISDDRVVEVGEVTKRGRREIDATDRIVTPGFVDIHTHLDAQFGWDPLGTSACWHGVTSVVIGNCGVTFAPVRDGDKAYLAAMMESVEDIPAQSILDGMPWDWETYGEYLAWLDRTPTGVNVGGMVGHSALRYYAMGERSLEETAVPTDDEMTTFTRLLDEALSAGALGFSSSRTLRHRVPDGRYVPGTFADFDELMAIADVLSRRAGGIFEVAPRFDGDGPSEPRVKSELAWMEELSRRSNSPVTLAVLGNADRRAELIEEARGDAAGLDQFFILNGPDGQARYDCDAKNSLMAVAQQRNVTPVEAFIDLALETDGQLLLSWPLLNQSLEAIEEMLQTPEVLMGLADTGAHVGQTMDASAPTHLLTYWVRERQVLTIEDAVRRITSDTAQTFGIVDRGVLTPGAFADINIINYDDLSLSVPEYRHDFPHGAGRFAQKATGYEMTIVNGQVFMENGESTGALAGSVIKSR